MNGRNFLGEIMLGYLSQGSLLHHILPRFSRGIILAVTAGLLQIAFAAAVNNDIKSAQWTVKSAMHSIDTAKISTVMTKGWYLAPDKLRIENDNILLIQHGLMHSYYDKISHTYSQWKSPELPLQWMPVSFSADNFVQPWKNCWVRFDFSSSPGNYHGEQCEKLDCQIPSVLLNQLPIYGPCTFHAITIPLTNHRMLAYQFQRMDNTGNHLLENETVEFTYDGQIDDSLFNFIPPADSQLDYTLKPAVIGRNLLPFSSFHIVDTVISAPTTPAEGPAKSKEIWYKYHDVYRYYTPGNSFLYRDGQVFQSTSFIGGLPLYQHNLANNLPHVWDNISIKVDFNHLYGRGYTPISKTS